MSEREELQKSLEALEAQRGLLGDAVVGPAIDALREKLAILLAQEQAHNPAAGGKRQRKLVTVLFADLVNFTAIAEHMDPEDVQLLIKTYFERWKQVIEQFGGTVEKFIGDAVMAVWGAHIAHEDDPERAIRASLLMREALRTESWSLDVSNRQRDENPFLASGLHMRVGINTGLVLVGELAENAQFTIIGDTVNTASRLEHVAPVDGVLISHDTYRHVAGNFEVQAVEPLALKGKTEPVQTYLVFHAHPQSFRSGTRGVEGIQTRMVGREFELEKLKTAWEEVAAAGLLGQGGTIHATQGKPDLPPPGPPGFGLFSHQDLDAFSAQGLEEIRATRGTPTDDRHGRSITVIGDAGLGKSRLLFEFQNWMEANPRFHYRFQVRAVEQMIELPYSLLRSLFAMRFQIQNSDNPATARQKLEEGFLQFLDQGAQEKVHFIGHLLGYDYSASPYLRAILADIRQIRDRATMYLVEFFNCAAARQPLVIYLEDIHWADENSLDLLRQVQEAASDKPLFLIAMARPELFERYAHWGQGNFEHRILTLKPLSKSDTYALIEDILRKVRRIPSNLREMVAEEAEGNPFYVEELIKMLIDERVIVKSNAPEKADEPWRVASERLSRLHVPPTLTGVLQARLDALPLVEREALQAASVIGRIFWTDAVRFLLSNAPDEELRQQVGASETILHALNGHELIFQRRTSSFASSEEYVFKHSILHEVTYETVLKSSRRVYHGAMARWLSGQGGERADEYAGLIAAHFEKAEEMPLAAGWYYRAGRRAASQYAGQDALAYLEKALSFTPLEMMEERYMILLQREAIHDLLGNRSAQGSDLDLLSDLAERLGDVEHRAEVAILHANLFEALGNYAPAQAMAQAAIQLVEEAPAYCRSQPGILRLAEAQMAWGVAAMRNEDYSIAHDNLQRALSLSRLISTGEMLSGKAIYLQAEALRHLGNLYYFQNDSAVGANYHNLAMELYRDLGNLRGEAYTLVSLGALAIQANQFPDAIDYHERGLKVSEKIGDQLGQARAMNNLGDIYAQLGDFVRAMPYLVYSYEIFDRINHRHGKSVALANLQDIYLRLGKFEHALTCNRKWVEQCEQANDRLTLALAYQGAAHFYIWIGDYARAEVELERSAELLRENKDPNRQAGLRYLQASCFVRAGKVQEASQAAYDALAMAQVVKDVRLQAQVWTVLGLTLADQSLFEQARRAHQQAESMHRASGFPGRAIESHLYLGVVALAQGETLQALAYAQAFLEYVENSPLGLLEDILVDFWAAYQILRANNDARAEGLLNRAHQMLLVRARLIQDENLRRCYLEEIKAHHAILCEHETKMG